MSVRLDHTIVWCRDKHDSAEFLARILGLEHPVDFGDRVRVEVANGVCFDYQDSGDVRPQHYALLVDEDDFDSILRRITDEGLEYYAQGGNGVAHQTSTRNGGRVVYFSDPDRHSFELVTRHMVPEPGRPQWSPGT